MNLPYQSHALQDCFVANILNFKRNGFFIDIGACHAVSANNSYALEALDWSGICIEIDSQHNKSFEGRKCEYINGDATKIDYPKLLWELAAPKVIDYLSLDIDALSTQVLKKLPLDKYIFTIITIEHDEYHLGNIYRNEQREILLKNGDYVLYCPDVLVPVQPDTQPDSAFEDWYLHKSILPKIQMNARMYPKDIITALQ